MVKKFLNICAAVTICGAVSSVYSQPATMTAATVAAASQTKQQEKNFQTKLSKREQSKNKAAQAEYVKGEIADQTEDFKAAIRHFSNAIDIDPDFFAAHQAFIRASVFAKMLEQDSSIPVAGLKNPAGVKTRAIPIGGGPAADELIAFYNARLEKYPKTPAVYWGLGMASLKPKEYAASEKAFLQALKINKKFAPAYEGLSLISSRKNDSAGSLENLRLAMEYDKSAERIFTYARALGTTNPTLQKSLYEKVIKEFPTDKNSYYSLYALASNSTDETAKMNYLEKLWQMFPNEDSLGHNYTMQSLFNLLALHKPETALQLAEAMNKTYSQVNAWKEILNFQKQMIFAGNLIKEKKFAEANAYLKDIKPSRYVDATPYHLLKAQAEGSGDLQQSYNLLLQAASKGYSSVLNKAVIFYASKIGKTPADAEKELWNARIAGAEVFKDFRLARHDTGAPVQLSDYRGKVVFLSFWFPGCGPCIAEFPYLRDAMAKFQSRGLEMVFVNIVPSEDGDALRVLKLHQMDFVTSLKSPDEKWATREYNISGAPGNFLIDSEGRAIFKPRVNTPSEVRDFEKQIEILLAHKNSVQANDR